VNPVEHILSELQRQGVMPHGISADSRCLSSGELFAAMPGARSDGRQHIAAALRQGASAVVWESGDHNATAGDWQAALAGVPNVAVEGLAALSGALAHAIYGRPSEQLWLCGITGTNGKTSVSQWIAQALEHHGRRCGVIGTLGNGMPGALRETANTTPDAIRLHACLAEMKAAGAQACAMEVSSIGLDQGRVNAAHFDTVVFTNLTRDHLEYHGNMMAYAAAKARLFALPDIRTTVINLDDPLGVALTIDLASRNPGVRRIGYTLDEHCPHLGLVDEALMARQLQVSGDGLRFQLPQPGTGQILPVQAPLIGRFNAANLLAVIGALRGAGLELEVAIAACAHLTPPPGRLQIVVDPAGRAVERVPLLVVDYAHTPDALEQALRTLREVASARHGKLHCVFGCGGDRDAGKRPLMGRMAERLADSVIVTSDNPRSEDAAAIAAAIVAGMTLAPNIELDRALAIHHAVQTMQTGDVLLIAGKGHEPYQEIAGQRLPFSDLDQATGALHAWGSAT
jgi:UDP-N-acetylmuramoyl-L-alanyl-D-glutamate--2,6-diaminopimelate ligase